LAYLRRLRDSQNFEGGGATYLRKVFDENVTKALGTTGKVFIDKVSIQGCEDIADFLKEIKNLNSLYLRIPSTNLMELVGESLAECLDGKSRRNPLVVKTIPIPIVMNAGLIWKVSCTIRTL
jgi:hypothetical protein